MMAGNFEPVCCRFDPGLFFDSHSSSFLIFSRKLFKNVDSTNQLAAIVDDVDHVRIRTAAIPFRDAKNNMFSVGGGKQPNQALLPGTDDFFFCLGLRVVSENTNLRVTTYAFR